MENHLKSCDSRQSLKHLDIKPVWALTMIVHIQNSLQLKRLTLRGSGENNTFFSYAIILPLYMWNPTGMV